MISKRFPTVDEVMESTHSPHLLIFCIRPAILIATAKCFLSSFNLVDVLYAVKCNMETAMLDGLWEGGVRQFDCASLKECMLIRTRFGPTAKVHFLHPVKSLEDIMEVYTNHSVKTFAVDSAAELKKIFDVVGEGEQDLTLVIRLALPLRFINGSSVKEYGGIGYSLSGKFGIDDLDETVELLRQARSRARRLGVSFHVGSQCTDPINYTRALSYVNSVLDHASVQIEIVDIGGGFPIQYEPHTTFPSLQTYISTIENGFRALPKALTSNARLWCEPGRALVASCGSLVIRVEDRRFKSNMHILYVNDGIFGHLHDAGPNMRWSFPVRLIRPSSAKLTSFVFYGPTCDSMDYMPGPFFLPSDVRPGDHIEVGQMGAYSTCFRTGFNGFDQSLTVFVRDEPMLETLGHNREKE